MIGAAGWYKIPPFGISWPLFCDKGVDILSCGFTVGESSGVYGFVPFMFLHTALFYLGTSLAVLLRVAGYKWSERSFKSKWDVGNSLPNLIMCVPMGCMTMQAAYEYWLNDDAKASWGYTYDMRVIETGTWFGTYLATDAILSLIHGMMDKDMVVHHIIFFGMCVTHFAPPVGPGFSGGMMMGQEISTPFLNIFLLCRGFCGNNSIYTLVAFLVFFLFFFVCRVILNTAVTVLYFQEFQKEITTGESGLEKSTPWLYVIAILVLGGCGMQLYFFSFMVRKVYKTLFDAKKKEKQ